LVNHFIQLICAEQGWKNKHINEEAIAALQQHNWPGNIRELRNVIERLIILSGDTITAEDVSLYV
jgi:DNA-binding NtrC family response regulator